MLIPAIPWCRKNSNNFRSSAPVPEELVRKCFLGQRSRLRFLRTFFSPIPSSASISAQLTPLFRILGPVCHRTANLKGLRSKVLFLSPGISTIGYFPISVISNDCNSHFYGLAWFSDANLFQRFCSQKTFWESELCQFKPTTKNFQALEKNATHFYSCGCVGTLRDCSIRIEKSET